MSDILIFLAGGYVVPAVFFGIQSFLLSRESFPEGGPAAHIINGLGNGLVWPAITGEF